LGDVQLCYYRLPDDDGLPSWDQFMMLVVTWFVLPLTCKQFSMVTLIGDMMALEGASSSDFLATCKNALHVSGGSSVLRLEGDNDMLSGGGWLGVDGLGMATGGAMGGDGALCTGGAGRSGPVVIGGSGDTIGTFSADDRLDMGTLGTCGQSTSDGSGG
jgi:hypothetical protein